MRRVRKIIFYTLLFGMLGTGVYLLLVKTFTIREVIVSGENIHVEVNQELLPKTLLFFPSQTLREELLATNPILEDIQFEKKYPHTIVMKPVLRKPAAIVQIPDRRVFVDSRGYVLSDADTTPSGLPILFVSLPAVRIGQKLTDARILFGLAFCEAIRSVLPVEELTITETADFRARSGKIDILFTQDRDIQTHSATLQTIMSGFRIKGTLPTVIDLRFDKPVVKF